MKLNFYLSVRCWFNSMVSLEAVECESVVLKCMFFSPNMTGDDLQYNVVQNNITTFSQNNHKVEDKTDEIWIVTGMLYKIALNYAGLPNNLKIQWANPNVPKCGYRTDYIVQRSKNCVLILQLPLLSFPPESASVHADHPGHWHGGQPHVWPLQHSHCCHQSHWR